MDQPSHLRALQALELALRTGSLTGAASRLAITPAAVGQRVKALEDYLGIDLLVRGRSGLQPTPELSGALPHLHAAFRELALAADLLELQKGQQIRIAAASDIVELWLAPRLVAFQARHPNIQLEINGEGEPRRRMVAADCEICARRHNLIIKPIRHDHGANVMRSGVAFERSHLVNAVFKESPLALAAHGQTCTEFPHQRH